MKMKMVVTLVYSLMLFAGISSLFLVGSNSVAQTGGDCGTIAPSALGIRYSSPPTDISSKISMAQAIATALQNVAIPVGAASTTSAQFVIFSDDVRGTADNIGDDDSVKLSYQNVPAWVVTFCGLSIPPAFRRGVPTPTKINYAHEWNVVINAVTGEYMEEFSFR